LEIEADATTVVKRRGRIKEGCCCPPRHSNRIDAVIHSHAREIAGEKEWQENMQE
jgi:hypothetical protein